MMRLQLSQSVSSMYVHLAMVCIEGRDYFKRNATGTQGTMPKVNQATVAGAPLPLPPAAEMSRIVTRVAQLRRLCADLRQRLAASQSTQAHLAEALVQSVW
jgi:type I restriction enzyme S subunit